MLWWGWLIAVVGVPIAAGIAALVVFFVTSAGKVKRWRAEVLEEVMRGLVKRVRALRKRKPTGPDEKQVAKVTREQADSPLDPLPDGFTDGWEVSARFLDLDEQDEENLPDDGLDAESLTVRLKWDNEPALVVIPPRKKGKRKSRGA